MGGLIQADQFTDNAGTGAPTFPFGLLGALKNYWLGGFSSGNQWSTNSTSFIDGTFSGSYTLGTRLSSNIAPTGIGTSCGFQWVPPSASSVYLCIARVTLSTSTSTSGFARLIEGTNTFTLDSGGLNPTTGASSITLSGIYAPAGVSPAILKLQFKATSPATVNTFEFNDSTVENVNFALIQIF